MKEAHDRAVEILSSKRDQMDLMATVLLERETIDGDACQALLNNRWAEYLQEEQAKEAEGKKPELETAEDAPADAAAQQDQQASSVSEATPAKPEAPDGGASGPESGNQQ